MDSLVTVGQEIYSLNYGHIILGSTAVGLGFGLIYGAGLTHRRVMRMCPNSSGLLDTICTIGIDIAGALYHAPAGIFWGCLSGIALSIYLLIWPISFPITLLVLLTSA